MLLSRFDVRLRIAELIEQHLAIPAADVLSGKPFAELHEKFDSLAYLELQLLLEEAYGFEFDMRLQGKEARLPTSIDELADEVIRQYYYHAAKFARAVH